MSENQDLETPDTEGHVLRGKAAPDADGDDDVEGHKKNFRVDGPDEDVEGHGVNSNRATSDGDDTEGHATRAKV